MGLRNFAVLLSSGALLLGGLALNPDRHSQGAAFAAESGHGGGHESGDEGRHDEGGSGGKGKGQKQYMGGGKGHAGHNSADDGHKGASSHAGGSKTLESEIMHAEDGHIGGKGKETTKTP